MVKPLFSAERFSENCFIGFCLTGVVHCSYDPIMSSSESESGNVPSEEGDNVSINSKDSAFDYPFMSSGSEEEREGVAADGRDQVTSAVRLADSRQNNRDWSQFGGERDQEDDHQTNYRFGAGRFGQPTPHGYWDRRGPAAVSMRPNVSDGCVRPLTIDRQDARPNAKLGKFNAPAPFASDLKQSEKYERWLKWKTTFDIALSICDGVPTDHQKVGLLYTYVGDETRGVIAMLRLPPMRGDDLHEGGYQELSQGLNDYFRSLVDESTDFARYNERKQLPNESVHQFAIKLRDLAIRVKVSHDSIGFRHQFLAGLANRPLAKKATEEGMSIGDVMQQAGRMEQVAAFEDAKGCGDGDFEGSRVLSVAAKKKWSKGFPKGEGKRKSSAGDNGPRGKWKQCGTCGQRQHEPGRACPAIGKECLKCGVSGHFARVCKKNSVDNVKGEPVIQAPTQAQV